MTLFLFCSTLFYRHVWNFGGRDTVNKIHTVPLCIRPQLRRSHDDDIVCIRNEASDDGSDDSSAEDSEDDVVILPDEESESDY